MVAKISSSSSLGSALAYNINKVSKGQAQVLGTNLIFCPADGAFKTAEVLSDFETFMPLRYRTENPTFHVSLNPHPDDDLSDAELTAIAEEYIERMGYGDQPYLIFKHEDIDRHHIHIVSTRVDSEGRKINDKFERRRSKDITRDIEQKYGLHTAEKSTKSKDLEFQMVDISKGNVKEQVANAVREVNKHYHFMSFTEYKAVLSKFNITAEEVKGSRNGKMVNGIVYSATNDADIKVGNPFPAKDLGDFAGVKALEKKYITSKSAMEKGKMLSPLRRHIDSALLKSKTLEELKVNLYEAGVGVTYRENSAGRLYGITFIDHSTGAVLNGSRLGKNYSANAIVERLSEQKILTVETAQQFVPQNPQYSASSEQPTSQMQHQSQQDGSIINGSTGLFDLPADGGDDPEEAMFRNRMQQKQKKKRGRGM